MSRIKKEILSKLKEYANKMGRDHLGGDDYTSKKRGGLRDFDGYDNVDYNKDIPMDEGMFSTIDQIRKDSKNVRDFIKKVLSDKDFRDMKTDKDFVKYLKSIYEGIEENFPSNWMQGRTSDYHTQLRGKKKDYSGGTNFKNKNHGQPDLEEVHKVAGRPVKINKGKKKDGTDWTVTFKNGKTVPLSDVLALIKPFPKGIKESGKEKSEKNYKDWKSTNEGFDKIEHLKLLNKAMRAMPGSPKQKDIIKKLNVVRKAGGMKPLKERTKPDFNSKGYKEASKLVAKLRSTTFKKMNDDELEQFRAALAFSFDLKEYASKLTLSYILDKDSKLDGTPEDIKAIDEKAERDYKAEYKKFQSSTKAKKYRAELNKYNRQKGTYGNGDGKDASHKGGKIVGFESQSKNRGRREKSRLKKESVTINEIGVFPITNYMSGIVPDSFINTTTPKKKEKLKSTLRDLKDTLNRFWKQHNIPYRIK